MNTLAPIIFLSHGGGPLPLLGDPEHQSMVDLLKQLPSELPKPEAIVVISAHWEANHTTVTAGANPALIYDYYGFPPESYEIQYPAAGQPALARRVAELCTQHGLPATLDEQRGFDHGLFVPLKLMYPEANIPCIQVSLLNSLDARTHIALGKALAPLRKENVLIIGSGFSFHNLRVFFAPANDKITAQNEAFESWLIDTCTNTSLSEEERQQRLINWHTAPSAQFCHPRVEHLLPLHVCYGAAGTAAKQYFNLEILGKQSSTYLW